MAAGLVKGMGSEGELEAVRGKKLRESSKKRFGKLAVIMTQEGREEVGGLMWMEL